MTPATPSTEQPQSLDESRPTPVPGASSPSLIAQLEALLSRQRIALARVGALLLRRARYVARFIYWTLRHRSPRHAAWVAQYEGEHW